MKVVILGSTGLLGQALVRFYKKNCVVICVARKNSDYNIDVTDDALLIRLIEEVRPDLLINCTAIVDIDFCEKNPNKAYMLNGRVPAILSNLSLNFGFKFVQISTDHYYTGNSPVLHKETDTVFLVNEYARSKYIGECCSLTNKNVLVIRTNIVGMRNNLLKPTFLEWVIDSIYNSASINVFYDMFTSPIHVDHFSEFLDCLIVKDSCGIYNLSGRDVVSKEDFIIRLLKRMNLSNNLIEVTRSSVLNNGIARANSLGLDTSKSEHKIGKFLPSVDDCIEKIVLELNKKGG